MIYTTKYIVLYVIVSLSSLTLAVDSDAAARELTVCDTLKACFLINIQSREETVLSGKDSFELNPMNTRGYSIRCDVNMNREASMDFIKFYYDGIVQDEFGEPRYMNGDSGGGTYINDVKYLSTCGPKIIKIEGSVWSNPCFEKEYMIDVLNTGGKPCTTTVAPVKPPTRAPVKPPTLTPVKPPTSAPVKPPTPTCVLPPQTQDFSIITYGDATIGAHSLYKGVGIGGTLFDGSPTEYGTVDRTMSYIKNLNDPNIKFHFNGGLTVGQTLPPIAQFMYDQFIYLATNAVSAKYSNGYEVFVLRKGGTYNLYDFVPRGQGENNGKTLVIFNTHEDVKLTSIYGRQFGPSILAPFSKVIVLGDAGYVDGFVIGKTVHTSGRNQSGLQFHGDGYTGPLTCK